MTKPKITTIFKGAFFMIVLLMLYSCKHKSAFKGTVYQFGSKKYGYTISFKEKLIIKQENIPTFEGNYAFKDSSDAKKVMNLVIEKLQQHQSPTVSKNEIEQLNITTSH
ncbi:MAG: DUF4907 domain-containing protein [Flavobacterium sp.]